MDPQTRDCQTICSNSPVQLYSENINMRCVASTQCPSSPSLQFGDNSTHKCQSNCSAGQFGDPKTRNCVIQCPKKAVTLTDHYYGDSTNGINLCV